MTEQNRNYSRGSVNQMWILKNPSDLLEYIQSRFLYSCNSIKTFDLSTFFTTIPHSKLQDKLIELIQLCFIKKNDQRRYRYHFVRKKTTLILPKWSLKLISPTCLSTNCAPLLADLFLYLYEADFIQGLLKKRKTCPIL